jgi:preprotein translocase subunit YajC
MIRPPFPSPFALPVVTAPGEVSPVQEGVAGPGQLSEEVAQPGVVSEEQAPPPGGLFSSPWVLPALLFGIFWFVVIGPERKAKRRRQEMLDGLKKGDQVLTTGGLFGSVAQVHDNGTVTLQVADGVRLKFARSSVQGITEKDAE